MANEQNSTCPACLGELQRGETIVIHSDGLHYHPFCRPIGNRETTTRLAKMSDTMLELRNLIHESARYAAGRENLLQEAIQILKDVTHGPEQAWNEWLYRKNKFLEKVESK